MRNTDSYPTATPCFWKNMKFNLHNQSEFARRGELEFPRGNIQTPAFMPVGTNGTDVPCCDALSSAASD